MIVENVGKVKFTFYINWPNHTDSYIIRYNYFNILYLHIMFITIDD